MLFQTLKMTASIYKAVLYMGPTATVIWRHMGCIS